MATITGMTAARMLAIEAASVVDGDIVGDDLILTKHDGSQINAGDVRGPAGPTGPTGTDTTILTSTPVLDVGMVGQIRAGRLLTPGDFTNIGLAAPIGLYPLSGTPDTSGNGRNLTNKGTVVFTGRGIAGGLNSAVLLTGSTSQGLYITDTGAADPFRIKVGSFGCWFRTGRKVPTSYMAMISKTTYPSDGQMSYWLEMGPDGRVAANFCPDGLIANKVVAQGVVDWADDRWHFAVVVHDGARAFLYIDSVLEAIAHPGSPIFQSNGPFNIGSSGSSAGAAGSLQWQGNLDEAFITGDILSEDQIRNLYAARILHGRPAAPTRIQVGVKRLKKGAALVSGDFPSQPLRLYNFTAGALTDAGSNGQALTNNGGATAVPGADGLTGNAFQFIAASTQNLSSTDTGLPSGTTSRSFGCWFKAATVQNNPALVAWGGAGTSCEALYINSGGVLVGRNVSDDIQGLFVVDGVWHFAVLTEDNLPSGDTKRKLYLDGKCIGSSMTLVSITLGGANRFRVGHWPDGSGGGAPSLHGQIDSVFVCNYILTPDQIATLYAKGSQALGSSPKNAGDHVESISSTELLCVFDQLESQHQVDLVVN